MLVDGSLSPLPCGADFQGAESEVDMCVMEDNLTKAERSLVDGGEGREVLDLRRIHQRLMRDQAIKGVEQILERKVISFMSDNDIDPDLAAETWVLAPVET